ncbi:MAG: hypothetical protein ACFFD5_07015 [Candidatus Thorarchaeota archaeon]
MPPPITNAVGLTGTVFVGISSSNCALEIPALISSIAFKVAFSLTSFD